MKSRDGGGGGGGGGGDVGGGVASPNLSILLYHVSVSSDGVTYFIMCCGVKCGAVKVGKAGLAGGIT